MVNVFYRESCLLQQTTRQCVPWQSSVIVMLRTCCSNAVNGSRRLLSLRKESSLVTKRMQGGRLLYVVRNTLTFPFKRAALPWLPVG
jgi:hypothetical protein